MPLGALLRVHLWHVVLTGIETRQHKDIKSALTTSGDENHSVP